MPAPDSIDALQEAVRSHSRVLAVGARTKPRLSQVDDDSVLIDMTRLTGITEYNPSEFTFTALAGTPVSEIEDTLAAEGQFMPFAPLLRGSGATIGGTVAAGFGGPGRFRFGGVRDFILGIRFVDGDARLIAAGGKVVKNAAGFDLPKFMVGSLGRFGILAELTFKVFPKPPSILTLRIPCADPRSAAEKIVTAASSRWELQAIDYTPCAKCIYMRLGGPADANAAIADEIEEVFGRGIERLAAADSEAIWEDVRELRWTAGAAVAIKAPITPREIVPLEQELSEISGISTQYGVGGNVAKIALAEKRLTGELDRILRQLDLRGMAFIGEDAPLWFGERPDFEIMRTVKRALDPVGRFPEL